MSRIDRIPLLGRLSARVRAIDWQRRDVRDRVVITALALVVYAAAHFGDLPPKLFQFGVEHAKWEVDDAIFIVFTMSIAMVVFVWRRMQDLSKEIKARRIAESNAQKLARHDPLTGLPNRRFFNEKLDEVLHSIVADGHRGAVLMLDLDGFKAINDVHGHLVGDKALVEFAERIETAAKGALVARVGGDEFAIVLARIGSLDDPTNLARRISTAVAEPFVIAGGETTLGVCIGIAVTPDDGSTAERKVTVTAGPAQLVQLE